MALDHEIEHGLKPRVAGASTGDAPVGNKRGRSADSPVEIPPHGWKDILWRVFSEISDDRVMLIAAGVTFYSLLALVPAITALVSIYGIFADPITVQKQIMLLQGFLPGGALEIIGEQVKRLAEQPKNTLGITFFVSLAVALWSANAGVKALFDSMNVAYDEVEKRGFFKLNLVTLTFTLAAVVIAILLISLVVALPIIWKFAGVSDGTKWIVKILGYAFMAALIAAIISAIYRWGPSRDDAEWKWITPGSVLATVVWLVVSILFSWYVANFGSYNATYGSLGAMIGFMTWIWISTIIVIMGGELNSEIEHQTAEDTTEGPDEPIGQRGAVMADNVGKAAD